MSISKIRRMRLLAFVPAFAALFTAVHMITRAAVQTEKDNVKKETVHTQFSALNKDAAKPFESSPLFPGTSDGQAKPAPSVSLTSPGTNQNEQLSYSSLMSVNTGFRKYDYLYYKGEKHRIRLSEELQRYTYKTACKYGVQYELIMGLMGVESGWDVNEKGDGTYVGLGMIYTGALPYLRSQIGVKNLYDPKQNIEAICFMISEKLALTGGNEQMALMCYNHGDNGAKKYFNKGIFTSSYSRRIVAFRDSLIKIKLG